MHHQINIMINFNYWSWKTLICLLRDWSQHAIKHRSLNRTIFLFIIIKIKAISWFLHRIQTFKIKSSTINTSLLECCNREDLFRIVGWAKELLFFNILTSSSLAYSDLINSTSSSQVTLFSIIEKFSRSMILIVRPSSMSLKFCQENCFVFFKSLYMYLFNILYTNEPTKMDNFWQFISYQDLRIWSVLEYNLLTCCC
jgi:hypothetical protein